jgi:hypothetical protein
MESCFRAAELYTGCPDTLHLLNNTTATITESGASYIVTSPSDSGTTFTIERLLTGTYSRTCTQPAIGGCDATGHW